MSACSIEEVVVVGGLVIEVAAGGGGGEEDDEGLGRGSKIVAAFRTVAVAVVFLSFWF